MSSTATGKSIVAKTGTRSCIGASNISLYIWSTTKRHKVEVILHNVFAIQPPLLAGVLSHKDCTKVPWKMYTKPVFFRDLNVFWRKNAKFMPKNTLIIDDSLYNCAKVLEGLGLLLPSWRTRPKSNNTTSWKTIWLPGCFYGCNQRIVKAIPTTMCFDTVKDDFFDAIIDHVIAFKT